MTMTKSHEPAEAALSLAEDLLLDQQGLSTNQVGTVLGDIMQAGVSDADIYFQATRSEGWSLEEGIVKGGSFSIDQGVGVRAMSGEKTAFAYSDDVSMPSLRAASAAVREIGAVGGAGVPATAVHGGHAPSPADRYLPLDPIGSLEAPAKVALLEKLEQMARALDPRVKQVMASLSGEYDVVMVQRADGQRVADIRPLVRVGVTVIVEQDGRREQGYAGGGGRTDYSYFTDVVLQRYAKEAVHQAVVNLDARPAPAGQMSVVLGPGWPGILLHEAIGHGLEGDFNRKGSSAFANRIGERVAAPGVTVVDDGTLTGEIAASFGIGYAPDGWQNLRAVFPEYDTPTFQALIQDGLVIENEQKRRYDRFRDRVMFPILDQKGQVIAFGGRILDQGEPKYLNSPETPLFEKGREVFGLPQAREACRQTDTAIVVEGYMDVVALAQHGIGNAVATLGTATTTTHVRKLLRMVDRVVFCFDGDAAGRKAAWRALENSLEALAEQKVLAFAFLPPEHDPDSYVRDLGTAAFQAAIDRATPLSEFLLQTLTSHVDLTSAEGRAKLLAEAKPLLQKIPTPMLRLQIVKLLADKTGLQPAEVERGCELQRQAMPAQTGPARAPRQAPSILRRLLRLLIQAPERVIDLPAEMTRHLPANDPLSPNVKRLLPLLAKNLTPSELLERVRGTEDAALVAEIFASLLSEPLEKEALGAELEGIVAQMERDQLDTELAALQQAAQRGALNAAEKSRYAELLQRLQQLGRTTRRR